MKRKINALLTIFSALTLFCFLACPAEATSDRSYQNAVDDASVVEDGENPNNLIAITRGNKNLVWNVDKTKILVVTWKSAKAFNRFVRPNTHTPSNEAFLTWVTAVPETRDFCRKYAQNNPKISKNDLELRLKQYLGLNSGWNYDFFVEMWVSPEDLFRPCVDPAPNDSQCDLAFGKTVPVVKGIKNYLVFYKNLYYKSFRDKIGVPWTGLGYTYDWGNTLSDQGASEFILVPGAAYEIKGTFSTRSYCGISRW